LPADASFDPGQWRQAGRPLGFIRRREFFIPFLLRQLYPNGKPLRLELPFFILMADARETVQLSVTPIG
jgi:hypothetical protein